MVIKRTPKGYGGTTLYGNTYDLSAACPRCGTGATRTSPLILKKSDLPQGTGLIQTGHGETLASRDIADSLVAEIVSGLELRDVRAWRSADRLQWVELASSYQMPPISKATTGGAREDPCPACGRDGYFDSTEAPLSIAYMGNEARPDSLPDIVHTWECFGNSRLAAPDDRYLPGPWFAQPLLLVKPAVAELLAHLGVRRLAFDPVRIVG
jgi:hypothetical protein